MLDLKSFIKQHPELVKSKQAFYSGLVDMYPNEKRAAKLIVIVYESGIAKKIAKAEQLDEITVRPLIIQLTEDYFIKEQYALDGIRYWAECFGKKLTYTIDSSMQTVPVQKAPPTFEPKTVPIQQNIPNSNIPHQIVSDNKKTTCNEFIKKHIKLELFVVSLIIQIVSTMLSENSFFETISEAMLPINVLLWTILLIVFIVKG